MKRASREIALIAVQVAREWPKLTTGGVIQLLETWDRLEHRFYNLALRRCNGPQISDEEYGKKVKKIMEQLRAAFPKGAKLDYYDDPRGSIIRWFPRDHWTNSMSGGVTI